jgi:hypothetical protein
VPDFPLAVDPSSGLVEGRIATTDRLDPGSSPPITFRGQKIRIDAMLDIELRQGVRQDIARLVVLADWPQEHASYHSPSLRALRSVAFDLRGRLYALLPYCTNLPMWGPCDGAIECLVKQEGQWSRPLTVGPDSRLRPHCW